MTLTHAIILAAGLGTRMRPLTETMPKPLIPYRGKALIDWNLDWLAEAGITQVVVNSSYKAEMLEAHLAARRGSRIEVSREEPEPLETGGGIRKALPMLGDTPFLAMNSDAVFPPIKPHPIHRLVEAWDDSADFLMLLAPVARAVGWQGNGDFIRTADGRVRKPREGEQAPYIFTGVEIIHPRAFASAPQGKFSLSLLWNAQRDAEGFFTRIRSVVLEGDWLNIGDLAGLAAAEGYRFPGFQANSIK